MKKILFLISLTFLIWSCEKNEIPIEPIERGNVQTAAVNMGSGYVNQVFYNLENSMVTGQTDISSWDLAFESSENGWKILLNDSRNMKAARLNYTDIEMASDSAGFGANAVVEVMEWAYTNPAMGNWRDGTGVYLVDLGFNSIGLPIGLYWLQVQSVNSGEFSIRFKPYGSEIITEKIIPKNPETAYVHYSMQEDRVLNVPSDEDWIIKFTKYTYLFDNPPIHYLVTGVVINPIDTYTAEIGTKAFEDITSADTLNLEWTDQPDAIGYDWKTYNFDSQTYDVNSERTWIIRTATGFYYKLRFTDFYDEGGNVGVPNFEFALI